MTKIGSLFRQSVQQGKGVQALAVTAMFVALLIVFNRLIIWAAPTLKIGFGFLALACIARLYGPVMAMKAGAIADIVSYILYPVGGFYFPGFTLTKLLEGMIYGCCLYGGALSWRRIFLARALVSFVLNVGDEISRVTPQARIARALRPWLFADRKSPAAADRPDSRPPK